MADDALRDAERGWQAAPGPQAAERLVAAARRAGRPAPEAALDARLQPARTFRSRVAARVWVPRGEGERRCVGETRVTGEVELPPHPWFEVEAIGVRSAGELTTLARDCEAQGVERVRLAFEGADPTALARFAGLTHLTLDRAAVDERLLRALPPGLVGLTVTRAQALSGLHALPPGLERLELPLSWVGAQEGDLLPLRTLPRLRALRLGLSWSGGSSAGFLAEGFAGLEALGLGGISVTLAELEPLARLPLRELELQLEEQDDPPDLSALARPPLRRLVLHTSEWEPPVALAAGLPLEHLALRPSYSGAELGRYPTTLTSVAAFAKGPLGWLERLPRLRALELIRSEPDGLEGLALAPRLERLQLDVALGVECVGLEVLRRLERLEELRLAAAPPPDALRGLERLARVALGGDALTDAHVERLAALPRLQEVRLGGHRLTPVALGHLARCSTLRVLELDPRMLGIPTEAVRELRRARPDLVLLGHDDLE